MLKTDRGQEKMDESAVVPVLVINLFLVKFGLLVGCYGMLFQTF